MAHDPAYGWLTMPAIMLLTGFGLALAYGTAVDDTNEVCTAACFPQVVMKCVMRDKFDHRPRTVYCYSADGGVEQREPK